MRKAARIFRARFFLSPIVSVTPAADIMLCRSPSHVHDVGPASSVPIPLRSSGSLTILACLNTCSCVISPIAQRPMRRLRWVIIGPCPLYETNSTASRHGNIAPMTPRCDRQPETRRRIRGVVVRACLTRVPLAACLSVHWRTSRHWHPETCPAGIGSLGSGQLR